MQFFERRFVVCLPAGQSLGEGYLEIHLPCWMGRKRHVVEQHGEDELGATLDLQAVHEINEFVEDGFNSFSVPLLFCNVCAASFVGFNSLFFLLQNFF